MNFEFDDEFEFENYEQKMETGIYFVIYPHLKKITNTFFAYSENEAIFNSWENGFYNGFIVSESEKIYQKFYSDFDYIEEKEALKYEESIKNVTNKKYFEYVLIFEDEKKYLSLGKLPSEYYVLEKIKYLKIKYNINTLKLRFKKNIKSIQKFEKIDLKEALNLDKLRNPIFVKEQMEKNISKDLNNNENLNFLI